MFKNKRIVIATICILSACIVAGVAIFTQRIALGNKSDVVVISANVKKGEKIEKSDIKISTKTSTDVPENSITDESLVIGMYAVADLFSEDIVTLDKISKTAINGDLMIATMDKDKIAIAVPIAGANGFNGKLIAGDIVKLYINNPDYKKGVDDRVVIEPAELQYMRIISITTADLTEEATKKDGGTYGIITFECTPFQATKLLESATHNLYLGYICHGNDERAAGLLNAQDELNKTLGAQTAPKS